VLAHGGDRNLGDQELGETHFLPFDWLCQMDNNSAVKARRVR
jgi:hypothetical protein